jgi:hypothetical protein
MLAVGKRCAVLSVGSNNDFRYERALVERWGCLVHVYDASSEPPKTSGACAGGVDWCLVPAHVASRIKHFKSHLSDRGGSLSEPLGSIRNGSSLINGSSTINLAAAVHLLRLDAGVDIVDVVKVDCEGCEFTALTTHGALGALAAHVKQVNLEVHIGYLMDEISDAPAARPRAAHRGGKPPLANRAGLKAIEAHKLWARAFHLWETLRLGAELVPFHKEANVLLKISSGDVFEYSFLNLRHASDFRASDRH